MSEHVVFVYGTLKKGYGNHHLLSRSKFLDTAVTRGVLHDLGAFPAARTNDSGGQIHGELYSVDDETLARLDRLEGIPTFYQRDKVETSKGPAWIYTMNNERLTQYPIIRSGEWGTHGH